jgi:hypothetical protein
VSLVTTAWRMARPQVADAGDGFQTRRETANVLNRLSRRSCGFDVGRVANIPHRKKLAYDEMKKGVLRKIQRGSARRTDIITS